MKIVDCSETQANAAPVNDADGPKVQEIPAPCSVGAVASAVINFVPGPPKGLEAKEITTSPVGSTSDSASSPPSSESTASSASDSEPLPGGSGVVKGAYHPLFSSAVQDFRPHAVVLISLFAQAKTMIPLSSFGAYLCRARA
jgi:hypothetical protein